MARASTVTMLSLDRFAQIIGIHPLHINQLFAGDCGWPMFQYAWQHPGRIGREDLAYAIQHAEDLITGALGFYPLATWSEEVLPISRRQVSPVFIASRGMFIEAGKEAKTLIEADAVITYSDEDLDLVDDLATITVATTLTDPEEIAVYYPGRSGDDAWEIRPTHVVISGGTATITAPRWQFLLSGLQEQLEPGEQDKDDEEAFLAVVDVYRKYTDPSVQAQFEGSSYPCAACSGSGCVSCTEVIQSACLAPRAPHQGIISAKPATWDVDEAHFTSAEWACSADRPLRLRAWYRSGWQNPRDSIWSKTRMDPRLERAIAILAMALIGEEGLCVCLNNIHQKWAQDKALQESTPDGTARAYKMSPATLGNPFGTTIGGLEAWRLVREVLNGQAAL